jgi:hypothetical protein
VHEDDNDEDEAVDLSPGEEGVEEELDIQVGDCELVAEEEEEEEEEEEDAKLPAVMGEENTKGFALRLLFRLDINHVLFGLVRVLG